MSMFDASDTRILQQRQPGKESEQIKTKKNVSFPVGKDGSGLFVFSAVRSSASAASSRTK